MNGAMTDISKIQIIFIVYSKKHISIDGHLFQEAKPPTALAAALKEQFPEIIRSSRYLNFPVSLQKGDEYISEVVAFADKDFLKMFNIEFKRGDINSVFNGPHEYQF